MRSSLIRHVDPWQDAARGARYVGTLDVDRLPRLSAMAVLQKPLQVDIAFQVGREAEKRGAVEIELEVHGRFEMICQRCLGALNVEPTVQVCLSVVRDEAAARALESVGDAIVSPHGERLDLAGLVEDELLLAMPFAPRHPPGVCEAQRVEQHDAQWGEERGSKEGDGKGDVEQASHHNADGGGENGPGIAGSAADGSATVKTGTGVVGADGVAANEDNAHGRTAKPNPFAVLAVLRDGSDDKE